MIISQASTVVEGATAAATALLAGNEAVINTLSLSPAYVWHSTYRKQSLSDVDVKLLYI
ncbi:MAG: hypothetical protein R2741_15725 [Methanolobus sp.]